MRPEKDADERQTGRAERETHNPLGREPVGIVTADDIARKHAETGQHDDQRQVLGTEPRGVDHQRADVAVPTEDAAVAQHHRRQHQPRSGAFQKPELPLHPRIGQRGQSRNPQFHEQHGHGSPHGDDPERGAPRHDAADIGSQRHAEEVGDGHAHDHDRHGLGPPALVGDALGDDRPHAEEGPVGKSRDETHGQQGPVVRRKRRTGVAENDQAREGQQDVFQRPRAGHQHRERRPEADAQRIGGDQVPRFGDRDAETAGDIGQNAHHHELRHTERQRPECQGDQTFLHGKTDING